MTIHGIFTFRRVKQPEEQLVAVGTPTLYLYQRTRCVCGEKSRCGVGRRRLSYRAKDNDANLRTLILGSAYKTQNFLALEVQNSRCERGRKRIPNGLKNVEVEALPRSSHYDRASLKND